MLSVCGCNYLYFCMKLLKAILLCGITITNTLHTQIKIM